MLRLCAAFTIGFMLMMSVLETDRVLGTHYILARY